MTWFEELSPCDYQRHDRLDLLAVGWLQQGHPFEAGDVDIATLRRLFELLRDPWQPGMFLGWHDCDLCGGEGPGRFELDGEQVSIGTSNVFVPDVQQDCVYIAPSMILHYIRDHRYAPPERFLDAVRACPPMRSPAYAEALGLTSREPPFLGWKDEEQEHPVGVGLRPALTQIVAALASGDCCLKHASIQGVESPLDAATGQQIADTIADYGEELCELPPETWRTSVAQWMGGYWHVLVDLWTIQSGCSDLVLDVRVTEVGDDGFRIEIHLVYVP